LKIRDGKFENIEREFGPDIIKDNVIYAINMLRNNKSAGLDQLPADIIKLEEKDQSVHQHGVLQQKGESLKLRALVLATINKNIANLAGV